MRKKKMKCSLSPSARVGLGVLALWLMGQASVLAQSAEPVTPAPGTPPVVTPAAPSDAGQPGVNGGLKKDMGLTWREALDQGGWLMYVLAGMSVFGLALVVYFLAVLRPGQIAPRHLKRELVEKLRAGEMSEARKLCEFKPSPLATVAMGAMDYLRSVPGTDPTLLKDVVVGEGSRQAERIQGQTTLLLDIAAVAPMVGAVPSSAAPSGAACAGGPRCGCRWVAARPSTACPRAASDDSATPAIRRRGRSEPIRNRGRPRIPARASPAPRGSAPAAPPGRRRLPARGVIAPRDVIAPRVAPVPREVIAPRAAPVPRDVIAPSAAPVLGTRIAPGNARAHARTSPTGPPVTRSLQDQHQHQHRGRNQSRTGEW